MRDYRICSECGRPMFEGYMVEGGEWYCCDACFEDAMRRDYPLGYRDTDEEGRYGGFWESMDYDGQWRDTGIFYTEWY